MECLESVIILDLPDVSSGAVNEAESAFVASCETDSVMRTEAVFDGSGFIELASLAELVNET